MKAATTAADRIADAAVDQLCLHGAAGLTVAAVATAAGISSALVHYHFESRQGLLRAAAERLPSLLKSLGAFSALAPHQLAAMVRAALDGFALALATGAPRDTVRSAYDAFWLVVIGAGQSAPP